MSSSTRTVGFQELVDRLNKAGQVGNRIGNSALKKSAEAIKRAQRASAPKHNGGPANGRSQHGSEFIEIDKVKTAKSSKNKYITVGLIDSEAFKNAEGIYFQHYGYINRMTGRYHAASLWMDKSFVKASKEAESILINELERGLKL